MVIYVDVVMEIDIKLQVLFTDRHDVLDTESLAYTANNPDRLGKGKQRLIICSVLETAGFAIYCIYDLYVSSHQGKVGWINVRENCTDLSISQGNLV